VERAVASCVLKVHAGIGPVYRFALCDSSLAWPAIPGLYAFVASPREELIYIGETSNLAESLPGHAMWFEAQMHGATDVYSMPFEGPEWQRSALKRALIAAYNPVCNREHEASSHPAVDGDPRQFNMALNGGRARQSSGG
jgi:hypothetical protein